MYSNNNNKNKIKNCMTSNLFKKYKNEIFFSKTKYIILN